MANKHRGIRARTPKAETAARLARPLIQLLLVIVLAACSGDSERAPSTGALSYAQGLTLSVKEGALVPFDAATARTESAYRAPQAAALAAIGHQVAIALNRHGLAFLDFEPQALRVSLRHQASADFQGRSVGGLFAENAGASQEFHIVLYRHPDETESETRQGALLAVDGASGNIKKAELPAGIDAETLYSLFPFANGARLLATRAPSADRVRTSHWLWNLGSQAPARAVSRAEFEDRLKPLGRAEAPRALLLAVEALTGTSTAPLLVEAHLPSGELAWYALGSGQAADRIEIIAALSSDSGAALAAYPAGPLAVCAPQDDGSLRVERLALEPPLPDAVWTAALLLADSGGAQAAVLAWREDYFPDSGASGILIAPLFR